MQTGALGAGREGKLGDERELALGRKRAADPQRRAADRGRREERCHCHGTQAHAS